MLCLLAPNGFIHIAGHGTTFHHLRCEGMDNYEDIDKFNFMSCMCVDGH